MRNIMQLVGGVAVAGAVAAGSTAFTATGFTAGGGVPATLFVGGTISQTVQGATLSGVVYSYSNTTNTTINGATLTFAGTTGSPIIGKTVGMVVTKDDTNTVTFTCSVITDTTGTLGSICNGTTAATAASVAFTVS